MFFAYDQMLAEHAAHCTCGWSAKAAQLLTAREQALQQAIKRIFVAQFREMDAEQIRRTGLLPMLESREWVERTQSAAVPHMDRQGRVAFDSAARRVGVRLPNSDQRERVREVLRRESFRFAESTSRSTVRGIRVQVRESIQAGETPEQLARRLQNIMGWSDHKGLLGVNRRGQFVSTDPETGKRTIVNGERLPNWRALRIAQTEMQRTRTLAEKGAWIESGVVSSTTWKAHMDPTTCVFCRAMNGRTVELASPVFVEGEGMQVVGQDGKAQVLRFNYGDVDGPPLHPNCRCWLVPNFSKNYRRR